MSKEMNKIFDYKNFQFNIQVRLNSRVEKRINGNRFHKVSISYMGSTNWVQMKEVSTNELYKTISEFQILAENFVDNKDNRSAEEKMLLEWGFS